MGEAHGGRGHAVLHVDPSWHAAPNVLDHTSGVNKVEYVVTELVRPGFRGMEVGGRVVIAVSHYPCLRVGRGDVQSFLDYDTAGDLRGENFERLAIFLMGAINVEMVGVHCGDDRNGRMKLKEAVITAIVGWS